MRTARRLAGIVAVCVLVTACGGSPTGPAAAPAGDARTASSTTAPSPAPSHGDEAPSSEPPAETGAVPETLQFRAKTVSGESFDGASLAGEPALLWFWAPWCPTCRSQIPQVKEITARHTGDLAVIGVAGLSDAEGAIAEFAAQVHPGVTHLSDNAGAVWRHFGIVEQSSFVLLDADGERVLTTGYGGAEDLADRVEALVG